MLSSGAVSADSSGGALPGATAAGPSAVKGYKGHGTNLKGNETRFSGLGRPSSPSAGYTMQRPISFDSAVQI